MKSRIDPPPALHQLAERQCGVVSRFQCHELGVTDAAVRRLLAGTWTREANGVYRVFRTPDEWLTTAWTGILLAGSWGMLGGWSAAHVLGLSADRPQPIEIWIRTSDRSTIRDLRWTFRRDSLGRLSRDSLAVTRVEQTIADCAATATQQQLAALIGAALSRKLTTAPRIVELVEEQRKLPGRRALLDMLADVATGAYSALEVTFLREVDRPHGLPPTRRQFRLEGSVLDVLFDEYGVIIELDGRLGHEGEGVFRDMDRDNQHSVRGLTTLRFGWLDVLTRPCAVARQIAEMLAVRGWPGTLKECPRCATR